MKTNMKKYTLMSAVIFCIMAVACDKYDDSQLKESISSLEGRVEALEKLNSEVESLKQLVQGKVFIVSTDKKDGKYSVVLSDGSTLVLYSADNKVPFVTMVETDGQLYWACYVDGKTEVIESDGKPLKVESPVTPQIRIRKDGYLEISADGGNTWIKTDAQLGSGGIFSSVKEEEDCLVLTFMDGVTEYVVPLEKEKVVDFVSFAGPQYFNAGQTLTVPIEMIGIDAFTITEKPEGWKASLTQGELTVTAPASGSGEKSGYIKMLGVGEQTKIAQVYVSIGKAPCLLSVDDSWQVTFTPNPYSCFYGACLMSEFDPSAIAQELSGVLPAYSRKPFTSSSITMPLSDLVGEIVDGERYVVWALPVTGEACSETDVLYQAVSSIGVTSEVSNVNFENASIKVSVSGTDTYYLIPMEGEITIDDIVSDLKTYERNKHTSTFRGELTDIIEDVNAGQSYTILILPEKFGKPLKNEAESFSVKLNTYTTGSKALLTLKTDKVEYKSVSVKVSGNESTYKSIISLVNDSDYESNGYSDDRKLLTFLSGVSAEVYNGEFTYTKGSLESGNKYWVVAVAVDENGVLGTPARLELSTQSVQYSSVTISLGDLGLTLDSALIPVLASADVESYRYMFLSSTDGGGFWYNAYLDDDTAAYEALIYGSVDHVDLKASALGNGISLGNLEFGSEYIFRIIGYDKDGKITNMAKAEFSPTVGKVVASSDDRWKSSKPSVVSTIAKNTLSLTVTFPEGTIMRYVVAKMSSEEYSANVPSAARLKTDYVIGHTTALTFTDNISDFRPDWYISSDKPYLLITWEGEGGWYEPLVYDTATGTVLN